MTIRIDDTKRALQRERHKRYEPHSVAARKAWVRNAALRLMVSNCGVATTIENRAKATFAAVETAAAIWDQVEGRYCKRPQNEAGD